MKTARAFLHRLHGLVPSERRERELAAEIESHLQMHIDDNLRAGMKEQAARREALLKLGGVGATKQAMRDGGRIMPIENLLQDTRFALRQLRKNPGFSCTAVFVFGLGMCAAVAIFAFVDAALLKPLPYKDPGRLLDVSETIPSFPHSDISYLDYLDYQKMNAVFTSLEGYNQNGASLRTATGSEPVRTATVGDRFFQTLGVTPLLGHDFAGAKPGAALLLLSYSAWIERYNGARDIIGKTATLNGETNTIAGVLPKEFHFAPAGSPEFWMGMNPSGGCEKRRSCHNLFAVGRLKDGVSLEMARANIVAIGKQLELQYPTSNRDQGAAVTELSNVITGDIRPILFVLLGGAGLLLLIATVNVANLLLVRSEGRRREIAVRSALGAGRGRLARQFVAEGVILVVLGSAAGLAASWWVMRLMALLIPPDVMNGMPYLQGAGLSPRVLAFAAILAGLTAVLFSLTPALRLRSGEIRDGLASGGRSSSGTLWRRLGSRLVVVELATAVVLLAGAGLLGQSLYRLLHVETGIMPDHLAIVQLAAPQERYKTNEQQITLEREIRDRTLRIPGVRSVGFTSTPPVTSNGNTTWFRVEGRPWHGEHEEAPERDVSTDYFTALGTRLIQGRYFLENDDASKPPVAIVNQALAKQYFPHQNVVGKRLGTLASPPVWMEIVGVVEDLKEGALDVATPPVIYMPLRQNPATYFGLVVRTSQAEASVLPAIQAAVRAVNPEITIIKPQTMNARINESQTAYIHRSSAWLAGGFAALALVLSVVGLYGVIAYSVSRRTNEIGVRMALGAQPRSVYRLILNEAAWLAAGGIAVGIACAIGATNLMRGMLFGVSAWDLPTLALVAIVLGAATIAASFIPARRAAALNPVNSLRAE